MEQIMSEVEELETPKTTTIEDLINTVTTQDFSKAGPTFAEIMQGKMADALEQEKISVADQVFNNAEPEDEDISDEEVAELDDVSDEEIDDAIDETEEDDD
jgi:formate dehydrogenase maturation protein FdhE